MIEKGKDEAIEDISLLILLLVEEEKREGREKGEREGKLKGKEIIELGSWVMGEKKGTVPVTG